MLGPEDVPIGAAPSIQREVSLEPAALLARLSKQDDAVALEGFPVSLAKALGREHLRVDLAKAAAFLHSGAQRERFRRLLALSYSLFEQYGLASLIPAQGAVGFIKGLKPDSEAFLRGRAVDLPGGASVDPARLKSVFLDFVVETRAQHRKSDADRALAGEEFRQEYALSYLLSPKQKDLLWKKLRGETMTKTEREYFSRVVRKKLAAMVDPDLQRLAQRALS